MDFKDHEKALEKLLAMVEPDDQLSKVAARKSRKQLQKDLNDSKDRYNRTRMSLAEKKRLFKELGEQIRAGEAEASSAKKDVLKTYDILKNMDLLDLQEVRMVGDDVGYVKNHRIYRLEDKDGDFDLVPWKKKMDAEPTEEEFDPEDLFDALEAMK